MTQPTTEIEDRLRRTLAAVAETTELDAVEPRCDVLPAGAPPGRTIRPVLVAAAIAVIALLAGGLALLEDGGDGNHDVIAGDPDAVRSGFFMPTALPDGLEVVSMARDPFPLSVDGHGPAPLERRQQLVVYGTRRDGGSIQRAIGITDSPVGGGGLFSDLDVDRRRVVSAGPNAVQLDWNEATDLTVARPVDAPDSPEVAGRGVDDRTLVRVLRAVLDGDGSTDAVGARLLPAGFEELYDGPAGQLGGFVGMATTIMLMPEPGSSMDRITVFVADGPPLSPVPGELFKGGPVRHEVVHGRAVRLIEQGTNGRPDGRIGPWEAVWHPRPGITMLAHGTAGNTDTIFDVIAGIEEVPERRWRAAARAAEARLNAGSRPPELVGRPFERTARQGGHDWTFTVQRERSSDAGTHVCVVAGSDTGHDTSWCARAPLAAAVEVSAAHRGDEAVLVAGTVEPDVATVRLETETGDVEIGPVDADADLGMAFFAVAIADDTDLVEIVALDADGGELGRARRVVE